MLKFTKASKKDGNKVTIRVNELFKKHDGELIRSEFTKGKRFILNIEGVETVFAVNRDGKTLSTNAFPSKLEQPTVGHPKTYNVKNVERVYTSFLEYFTGL